MKALIDWMTVTCLWPGVNEVLQRLSCATGLKLSAIDSGKGGVGFTYSATVRAFVDLELVPLCTLMWGGDHQYGRGMIEFTGSQCGCVRDWMAMRAMVEQLPEARLTRVDTAVDF